MSADLTTSTGNIVTLETVNKFFLDALTTRRYQFLKLAYNYKQEVANYNWLVDELFNVKYGLTRPAGFFADVDRVQKTLVEHFNDVPYALVHDVVERAVLATNLREKYVERYKQRWTLDQLVTSFAATHHPELIWWMSTNEFGLNTHFKEVVTDASWMLNLNMHLETLRIAFNALVRGLALKISLDLSNEKRLDKAYKKLTVAIKDQCASTIDLMQHYDFIKRLTKLSDAFKSVRYQDNANARFELAQSLTLSLQAAVNDLRTAISLCPAI